MGMNLKQMVLDAISASGAGMTTDAVEVVLARSHQAVSARVNELAKDNLIHDTGRRAYTRGRRWAVVWAVGAR